jgi:hypothetical protein
MLKDADLEKYSVNEYISLWLVRRRMQPYTMLMLGGSLFKAYNKFPVGIFLSLPVQSEKLLTFGQDSNYDKQELEAREEFNNYCSLFEDWVAKDYNIDHLNYNLTFPALRRLVELKDPLAQEVYPLQIKKMITLGNIEILYFLIINKYLEDLSEQEKIPLFNETDSDFAQNLRESFDVPELQSCAFPVLKPVIDCDVSWSHTFLNQNQEKIKEILIKQLYSKDKEERHRTAKYFAYFGKQFANKKYHQVIFELKAQDLVIKKLHGIIDKAVEKDKKIKDNDTWILIKYIFKDLIRLDDEKGIRKRYYLIEDDSYELGDLVNTYMLSKQTKLIQTPEVTLPECEVKVINDFEKGQKNQYNIDVLFSNTPPEHVINFYSYLREYLDYGEIDFRSSIYYTVKDNHIHGLYIFFSDNTVCNDCKHTFKTCYDECIYFCIPSSVGVLSRLEELVIFDTRAYSRNYEARFPVTLKFLDSLKLLRVPKGIGIKQGQKKPMIDKLTRRGTKIEYY